MTTPYDGPDRRRPDPIQEQIDQLILSANDPKDKAFLLILNKIAINLEENTGLTRALADDFKAHTIVFQQHEKDEMALINQGRGFWRAALGALFIIQGLGAWWVQTHLEGAAQVASEVKVLQVEVERHKEHHAQEEYHRRLAGQK